jgi:hypothetical protein
MTETMSSSWWGRHRESRRHSGQSRTPRGAVAVAQTGGARAAAVPPTAVAAQTGADVPVPGLTKIAAFTGRVALLLGQVPWSPWDPGHCQERQSRRWVAYPHQDQLRRVGHGDEGTAPGAIHVGSSRYGDVNYYEDRRALDALIVAVLPKM